MTETNQTPAKVIIDANEQIDLYTNKKNRENR